VAVLSSAVDHLKQSSDNQEQYSRKVAWELMEWRK